MAFRFNPFTGSFDIVVNGSNGGNGQRPDGTEQFSFTYIALGETLTIPLYQQMVVVDLLDVEGDLDVLGELALI